MTSESEFGVSLPVKKGGDARIRELDGWRALSVLLVIFNHICSYQHPQVLERFPRLAFAVHYFGSLGVKTFFVISGFVICRLLISEELRTGVISLKGFYYRRAFRILPPLYIYLVAVLILFYLGLIHLHRITIFYAVVFVRDLRLTPVSWFSGHLWSLAVEEQFYLTFPAALVFTPKRLRAGLLGGIFILCVCWNLSMAFTGWDALISSDIRAAFAAISCGALIAISEGRVRQLAKRVPAAVVTVFAFILLLHPIGSNSWGAALYESLFVPPAIGLVLLFSMDRGPWLRAVLCSRVMQAIGLTSYGIYLWQQLFTAPSTEYNSSGEFLLRLLPLLCLIVPASYFLVEKPAMRYGRYLSRRATSTSKCESAVA
jgi:peptidoglycan/LPS O-acetylase OafA/YrhL